MIDPITGLYIGSTVANYGAKAISWYRDYLAKKRNPQQYEQQQQIRQSNLTPSQYQRSSDMLNRGVDYLANPQKVYMNQPGQGAYPQYNVLNDQAPQVGQNQPQQKSMPSLVARLMGVDALNRKLYENRLGQMQAGFGAGNTRGVVSNRQLGSQLDMFKDMVSNSDAQKYNMLSDFANQNNMQSLFNTAMGTKRQNINNQFASQYNDLQNQQQQDNQANTLNQMQFGARTVGLENRLQNNNMALANKRYLAGQNPVYNVQRGGGL